MKPYDAEIEIAERWWLCLRGDQVRLENRLTTPATGLRVPFSLHLGLLDFADEGRDRFGVCQSERRSYGSRRYPELVDVDFDAALILLRKTVDGYEPIPERAP